MAKLLETPTDTLIHRLRLMAESGGNITRDRRITIIDAADRLESLDERVAIMSEYDYPDKTGGTFPPVPPYLLQNFRLFYTVYCKFLGKEK